MDLLLPIAVLILFALPMLLLTRSNRKRMAEAQRLQASIKPGDTIVNVAGLHGEVVSGDEATIEVEFAPGVVVKMERAGVLRRAEEPEEASGAESLHQADDADAEEPANLDRETPDDSVADGNEDNGSTVARQ